MAYDEELAERIRDFTEPEPAVTERTMFGGLSFLVGGNMAFAAYLRAWVARGVECARSLPPDALTGRPARARFR